MTAPRVILTGAGGLIGRQLLPQLKTAGFHVTVLSRTPHAPGADAAIAVDLLDQTARRAALREARATHMVHLAWHDAPQGRWSAPANLDWSGATIEMMREFADLGGKCAVAAGSCAEYDWSFETLREDTRLAPSSLYGHAKAATGMLLTEAAPSLGMAIAWARIFFVYGPGEPKGRLLGDLIHGLRNGEPVDCSDGMQIRDYLHSADVARGLLSLLQAEASGPVNLASGEGLRVRDLIERTGELMGHPELIRLGARPRPPNDPPMLVADTSLLRSFGFAPSLDLSAGLRSCIAASGAVPV